MAKITKKRILQIIQGIAPKILKNQKIIRKVHAETIPINSKKNKVSYTATSLFIDKESELQIVKYFNDRIK